jgi:hypothetical protein
VSQTIQISEKSAELLAQQAAEHGITVEAWIEELAAEKARTATSGVLPTKGGHLGRSLIEQMRELRSHVKPDPQGWTVRDYVDYGRR